MITYHNFITLFISHTRLPNFCSSDLPNNAMLPHKSGLQARQQTAALTLNAFNRSRASNFPRQHSCRSIRMSSSLPRRKLGNTEYDVCPLGFGASPLGSIYSVRVILLKLQVLV